MSDDSLLRHIQTLQYHDPPAAETLLLNFIRDTFPALDAQRVELRPSAVSLNSFNGYLTLADGEQLFFKTHVEPDSVIGEYYNAKLLAEAGYPVIQPRYASTEYGKQFLIYDRIESPSVFDVAHCIEIGTTPPRSYIDLVAAQHAADERLFEIYRATLAEQSTEDARLAPVHQLFHHRLQGGRYRAFYQTSNNFVAQSLDKHWIINGRHYLSTLRTLIAHEAVIAPARPGPSVIGHGDAHNGNVFLHSNGLVYFDPAFAGRHNPFLDLAKPLFHNVFASWMYHPVDHPQASTLTIQADTDPIVIDYDETLPEIRQMFFASKVERVLAPLIVEMRRCGLLPSDWRLYLKLALLCCPLLTMNLADHTRFPEQTAWLGLSYAIQMGAESRDERGMLDRALDEIEAGR